MTGDDTPGPDIPQLPEPDDIADPWGEGSTATAEGWTGGDPL